MLTRLITVLVFLWAGMILGISFLESWVKFRAPHLTKPVGLDVGRTVFNFFHKVQCVLLLIIIFLNIFTAFRSTSWVFIILLTSIFILQFIWLFPKLNQHVDIILSGNKISDPFTHAFYGICEIGKFLILILLGAKIMT